MKKRQVLQVVLSSVVVCAGALAQNPAKAVGSGKDWTVEVTVGAEVMRGDVTYQIGGLTHQGGVAMESYFPVSELAWPMDNMIMASLGVNMTFQERWEGHLTLAMNLTHDVGKMEDSDWESASDPSVLTTFSRSDASLDAWMSDLGLRYWILERQKWGGTLLFGAGMGYLHQSLAWDASNLDQWEPVDANSEHIYESGVVGTYEATVEIPYVEVAGRWRQGAMNLGVRLGISPLAMVEDMDDHILRGIRAKTSASGWALLADVSARYLLRDDWSVLASVQWLTFDVQGTENDVVYAGSDVGDTWDIQHTITSSQLGVSVAVGYAF